VSLVRVLCARVLCALTPPPSPHAYSTQKNGVLSGAFLTRPWTSTSLSIAQAQVRTRYHAALRRARRPSLCSRGSSCRPSPGVAPKLNFVRVGIKPSSVPFGFV
jgi:hypothetical protein